MRRDGDSADGDTRAASDDAVDPDERVPAELASVVEALDDECSREVLVLTADTARAADDVAALSGSSRSTVYRRIGDLVELDLLAESRELDPNGHHFNTYRARLSRVSIELTDEGFEMELERRDVEDDAVARLNRLTERLR